MPSAAEPGSQGTGEDRPDHEDLALLDQALRRLMPAPSSGGLVLQRRAALRALRKRTALRGRQADQLDPDVLALFDLLAIPPEGLEHLAPELNEHVQRGMEHGISREALPAVIQAFVRGAARIVAAESRIIRDELAAARSEDRAAVLAETLDSLVPAAERGFDVLHRILLLDAVAGIVSDLDDDAPAGEGAVAMVDLVGSTRYLSVAGDDDLRAVVDALFSAGQAATAQRHAHVVKYVGDGLFISGNDVEAVADAALDVIVALEATLPLRARGGLAYGRLVDRAGDLFGLPVNIAHVATKVAAPGDLVATGEAIAHLASLRHGARLDVREGHPVLREVVLRVVRPRQGPSTA